MKQKIATCLVLKAVLVLDLTAVDQCGLLSGSLSNQLERNGQASWNKLGTEAAPERTRLVVEQASTVGCRFVSLHTISHAVSPTSRTCDVDDFDTGDVPVE